MTEVALGSPALRMRVLPAGAGGGGDRVSGL